MSSDSLADDFLRDAAYHSTVEDAKHMAIYWHAGQDDGTGRLYFGHLQRVVDNIHRLNKAGLIPPPLIEELQVGWLHDILEDTDMPPTQFNAHGFSDYVIECVMTMKRDKTVSPDYEQFIDNIIDSGLHAAILGKLADNMDNLHAQRRAILRRTHKDLADHLDRKYAKSLPRLCAALGIEQAGVRDIIAESPGVQPIGPAIIPGYQRMPELALPK